MSMLAGPRKKQKVINLRAKNNAWSNDNNKFGQRMLEKMGWSAGKGLGAKENGIVEHVVAKYKNDEKGLGFNDKNDQWTKHEDEFNTLLANLSNAEEKEIPLHSGVSLEVKSKASKARVHYHKFTRGKDLSRYSEKDLANIFGKKSLKVEENKEESVMEPVIGKTEKKFTEKGSMEDYFNNKMKSLKSKKKSCTVEQDLSINIESSDFTFQGFSGTINDGLENHNENCSIEPFSFYNSKQVSEDSSNIPRKAKKSKKKKSKHTEDCSSIGEEKEHKANVKSKKRKAALCEDNLECANSAEVEKHKSKKCCDQNIELFENNELQLEMDSKTPKKKKKRKLKSRHHDDDQSS